MIDLIRLRENVACEFLAEGVVFVSERGSRLLTGRAERLVARCLDGSLTLDGIIEHLHSEASAAEVCFVVERLKRDGVIVSGPRLDASERGWEALGAEPEGVGRLGQAEIEIVSVGDVDASTIGVVADAVRRIGPRIALRSNVNQAQSATPASPNRRRRRLSAQRAQRHQRRQPGERSFLASRQADRRRGVGRPVFHAGRDGLLAMPRTTAARPSSGRRIFAPATGGGRRRHGRSCEPSRGRERGGRRRRDGGRQMVRRRPVGPRGRPLGVQLRCDGLATP